MEEIKGNGSQKLYVYNNNMYYLNREYLEKKYFRCKYKSCYARCVWTNDSQFVEELSMHNHEPATDEIGLQKFKESLIRRAKTEGGSLKVIFLEEQSQFPELASVIGSFNNYTNIMRRARQSVLPPVPRNWQELNNYLENPLYR